MPRFFLARRDYRYNPLDEVDKNAMDDEGYGPLDLDTTVPVPGPRRLNWDRILMHVPIDRRLETMRLLLAEHTDAFIDGDHKVFWDAGGVLRYWRAPAGEAYGLLIQDVRDLLKLSLPARRALGRKRGYSLAGFDELDFMGHHALYPRPVIMEDGRWRIKYPEHVPCWIIQ